MVFGPDGNFYVAQAYKKESAILQFSGTLETGSCTRSIVGTYVAPSSSAGLLHPYQPVFGPDGNLYVSSQDSNVVTAFYGPKSAKSGQAMPDAASLPSGGTFYPGTFVPAFSASAGIPPNTSVPVGQGGLTFVTTNGSTHSVRGLVFDSSGNLYVADEGNNRVSVFDPTGNFLGAITQSADQSISEPVALCFNPVNATLYIGSPGNQSLFTFDVAQVAQKNFTASFLFTDSKLDKLSGLAVDPVGAIYTCSRKDNEIHQWSESGGSWSHARFAGPFSDSPEQILSLYTPISG
jgi:DNA-binding beta-propeller fold protein YncE